jgi:hypothetical protein
MKSLLPILFRKDLIMACAISVISFSCFGQGLINNGAHIEVTPGGFICISGGAGTGNFQNQDDGISTGIVENQGTIEVSGDWNNVSTANVFNSSSGTVRLTGANQAIQGTTSTFFNNLELTGSGTKTLQVPTLTGGGFAAPAGILDLTTLPLDLNGFTLTVNNPATAAIAFTTGYIISETPAAVNPSIIQWNMGAANGNYVYPFGAAGTQIPFSLNKTAGTGNVSVSTRATALSDNTPWQSGVTNMYSNTVGGPGEIPVVIDRWWNVEPSAAVTAGMTFTYRGIENTTTYNPTGIFSAQNWNSLQWLPPTGSGPGVVAGTAAVTVPAQLISSTPWVLSNLDAPLPVNLLDLTAECNASYQVEISWSTAAELNNKFFTLEKSADGTLYEWMADIAGQGNSSQVQQYRYTDFNPFKNITYYRLSQTDNNGKTTFFKPVSEKSCIAEEDFFASAWHNGGGIHVLIRTPATQDYNVSLYDAKGRAIYSGIRTFSAGTSESVISTENISKGIYFLNLKSSTENLNFKIFAGN